MIVRRPVNFGWPFCITPDKPYVDYDFTPDAAAVRRRVQLQRADQRLAEQHRPAPAAGGRLAGGVVLVHHGPGSVPGAVQPHGARRRGQRHRADGRSGDAVRPQHRVGVPVAAGVHGASALLRVDAGLREALRAEPPERQPARRHPRPARRRVRSHRAPEPQRRAGQPDGHGVRAGQRALRARVRHRLLRGAARGAAGADRLRPQRPVHAGRAGVGDAVRRGRPRRSRSSSRAPARRTPTATAWPTRGTSTPTGPWTPAWRTRRTPTPRAASTRPRSG